MKKRVSELEGAELDYWVAKAEGINVQLGCAANGEPTFVREPNPGGRWFYFSTDWSQGGPIIEREMIVLVWTDENNEWHAQVKPNSIGKLTFHAINWLGSYGGATPLIAAMRCFVASKYGDEVDAP